MAKIPSNMCFRICVYPSVDVQSEFVAHCLDLDVFAAARTVQEALDLLLELIEFQIQTCEKHDAQLNFPAPHAIWRKYLAAKKAERYVASELVELVVADANKRLGHPAPLLDNVMATPGVPPELLALS